ncbi:probable 6-phosphogluconolactonase [Lucilia sericata]|uniref:probable 6-phosphogluconolactonase n=1 Tax=Lucilia sericata TaxID=13632 RepID=UPI0018A85031|nr:probable 6-phosphogluconolactonase [Lucilia sericata]
MHLHKVQSEKEVIALLGSMLAEKSQEAIENNGVFRLGVSGGSVVNYLATALAETKMNLDKFKFFFCDERFVPETDKDSTSGVYKTTLLPKTALKEEQFIGIDTNLTLKECAQDYEEKILKEFDMKSGDIPQFDLLILGMGPDGHTCSLFPQHPLLKEKDHLIAAIDNSPKLPPKRVTMTFPLINNAKMCMFVMCGEGKADIVKRIFKDKENLPAGMVKPHNNQVHLLLDEAAGKFI